MLATRGPIRVFRGDLTMCNDGHVTDVGRLVHQRPDLFDREAVKEKC